MWLAVLESEVHCVAVPTNEDPEDEIEQHVGAASLDEWSLSNLGVGGVILSFVAGIIQILALLF